MSNGSAAASDRRAKRRGFNPTAWVRHRFPRWWQARLPRTDTQLLTQRNVYIVPTTDKDCKVLATGAAALGLVARTLR